MEDLDFKVQQVLEELERMQPDIDNEVDAKFAERLQKLNNNQASVWGNVQAANSDNGAPDIARGNIDQIVNNFQEQESRLDDEKIAFRNERVNYRANFLIDQYNNDASQEEKTAIFEAVQNKLNPSVQESSSNTETEAGEGDYFDAGDFAYVDGSEAEDNSLSEYFSDATSPDPSFPTRNGGGFEA